LISSAIAVTLSMYAAAIINMTAITRSKIIDPIKTCEMRLV
jgi:hypothetical protein